MASPTPSIPSWLSGKPPNPLKRVINFDAIDFPDNHGCYAVIIDDAFTKLECEQLLLAAEAHNNGLWEQAMVNVGNYQQELMTDIRDCGRIIWDDHEIVAKLWSRIKHLVPEIELVKGKPKITGPGPAKRKETMIATRLNERMRFLKYGPGQYFRPHFDGQFRVPGGDEVSLFTLHLYLNGVGEEGILKEGKEGRLKGGATTFHSDDISHDVDVVPMTGRVLIFQHRGLMHSGADVLEGVKYTLRTDLMFRKVEEE